jgi:gliding motility-associated-like protein
MRRFFLAILVLLSVNVFAGHIAGGEMFYRYLGPGVAANSDRYEITLRLFRKCNPTGTAAPMPSSVLIGIFRNQSGGILASSHTVSRTSFTTIPKTDYSCIINFVSVCYQIGYYSFEVELDRTPEGYICSFQTCCRSQTVNIQTFPVIAAGGNFEGTTYICTIPGSNTLPRPASNSSPSFQIKDTALICSNKRFKLEFSAIDSIDHDSLSYEFCAGFDRGDADGAGSIIPSNPPYTALTYIPPFSGTQPLGSAVVINPRTGIISGIAPASGEYVVSVCVSEWRNGSKINTQRKDFTVSIQPCDFVGAELPLNNVSCNGFSWTFENLNNSGGISTYFWDFGVQNILSDTSILVRPTYTYADTGVYTIKLIVTSNGVCTDTATTILSVFPGFFPAFTNDTACANQPLPFTDRTTTRYGFVNKWHWDFGVTTTNTDTSIQQNPRYNYPAPGPYNVELIVASNKGCVDTVYKSITVLDRPPLNLPFHDTLICSIDTLPLIANGIGAFTWTPNINILNANTSNPLVWPVDTITYVVTLNRNGCVSKDSIKVNVLDFITVDAGPDTTICLTDRVQLNPISYALSYRWTPGVPLLDNPLIKRPFAKPTAVSTTFYLQANLGKCQARDSVIISTAPYPVARAGARDTICFGERVQLNGQIIGDRFTWTPSNTLDNPNVLNPFASPRFTTNYILTAFNNVGCPKPFRDTVQIRVIPKINAFAGNDTSIVIGQRLQLFGTGGNNYQWSPGRFLNFTNINNPIASILDPAIDTFRYFMTVTTEGCSASDDILVKVFKTPPSIFVPSAFTPDGDGLNDRIRPIIVGMKSLDFFRVYTRWGQLVYESNNPKLLGWDGNINGTPQKSEVYVYTAQATDYNNKVVVEKGTILLIR